MWWPAGAVALCCTAAVGGVFVLMRAGGVPVPQAAGSMGGAPLGLALLVALAVAWGVGYVVLRGMQRRLQGALMQTQAALHESETRLRLAMRATGLGLWDYRPGQEAVGSNEEVARLLGYDPVAFSETRAAFVDRLHPDDREAMRAQFRDYLLGHRPDYACDFRMRTASGSYRWFHSVGQVVERDADGAPCRVIGSYLDISERVTAMQRLAELSARLLRVQEEERRNLAHELHDEIGQQMTALHFNLHALRRRIGDAGDRARLDDCSAIAESTLAHIRSRAMELRPAMLDDMGLLPALEWYCERQQIRSGVDIRLRADGAIGTLPEALATAAFRIVQEAVNNALRHAGPRSVEVVLVQQDNRLVMTITDDGCGFVVPREAGQGFGLTAMHERAALAGGCLTIRSQSGLGSVIQASLPTPDAA